jgi:SAM-dependent methyltransferase
MSAAPEAFHEAAFDAPFDAFGESYRDVVQDSVAFSGLSYDYFLKSKACLLGQLIAERLAGVQAPKVLDVGCGVGALHPLLAPSCGELHGVDVSAACIERARADNPGGTYGVYDGARLPFEDGRFDVVFAACVMHHVPPPDWPAFAAELRRAARPGGLVCIIEHNPLNPATRLSIMRCPFDEDAVLLRRPQCESVLRTAGLGDVASRFFVFVPSTRPWALKLEKTLAGLPLGAQYAAFGRA